MEQMKSATNIIITTAVILFLSISTCSCKNFLYPPGRLYDEIILFEFAIYYVGNFKNPETMLNEYINKSKDAVFVISRGKKVENIKSPTIIINKIKDIQKNYAPPDLESIHYFGKGLDKSQALALQKCQNVYVLDYASLI